MENFLTIQTTNPFLLVLAAIPAGLLCAFLSRNFLKVSASMQIPLFLLPAIVCASLLAVNGSLGTGIAVLGIFGLVRFRSMPGNGKDLVAVFYAMACGLLLTTGYVLQAWGVCLILGALIILGTLLLSTSMQEYTLRILVPESCTDFETFTEISKQFGKKVHLCEIRSTNLGSMFELKYTLLLKSDEMQPLLDEIRVHNSNLNVSLTDSSLIQTSL